MPALSNLVIDLGGVLYAIDPPRAVSSFLALHPKAGQVDVKTWIHTHQPIFDSFETGETSPAMFRDYLRAGGGLVADDDAIDAAWNSLLLGVIPGRVNDLGDLRSQYRLILLSNTNIIHQKALRAESEELFAQFEHLFFSYDMGLRKPDERIYLEALKAMGMDPAESLFVDDNVANVEAAVRAGLQGAHVRAHSDEDWNQLVSRLKG